MEGRRRLRWSSAEQGLRDETQTMKLKFRKYLADDVNTAGAVAELRALCAATRKYAAAGGDNHEAIFAARHAVLSRLTMLGLNFGGHIDETLEGVMNILATTRESLRKMALSDDSADKRDLFRLSDGIRDKLAEMNVTASDDKIEP